MWPTSRQRWAHDCSTYRIVAAHRDRLPASAGSDHRWGRGERSAPPTPQRCSTGSCRLARTLVAWMRNAYVSQIPPRSPGPSQSATRTSRPIFARGRASDLHAQSTQAAGGGFGGVVPPKSSPRRMRHCCERESLPVMTLSAAWIRSVGNSEELVMASDSRLRGGEAWDCCPKILPLPRGDCAIAFAGETWWAYPLMLQMANAIGLHQGSSDRRIDITDLKGHSLRVFEQMLTTVTDLPVGRTRPDRPLETEFLFAGYSWKFSQYKIWRLHFDAEIDRYTFRPISPWGGQAEGTMKTVAFAGDISEIAEKRLRVLLRDRDLLRSGSFNMEPFEVIRDLIREREHPTIGGAPQVVKVYKFARTQVFGVHWPDKSGGVAALGRQQLLYERLNIPTIDPDRPSDFASRGARGL